MCIFRHHFLGWCSWPVQPWLALCLAPLTLRPVRWKPRAQSQWTWLFCSLLQFHWRSVCSDILYFITAPIINEWMVIKKIIPVTGNNTQLARQSPQISHFPICLRLMAGRVFYLLWKHSGHGHLCLRTHVSLLHLWPSPQKNGQR